MIDTWSFANTAAGRVLRAIQMRGQARVDEVAADLGVSASAVRQHVGQLQASGALRTDKVRDGVGRPYHVYSVTPEGYQLFQNDYGDLARFLLDEVSEVEEPRVLGEILSRTAVRMASKFESNAPVVKSSWAIAIRTATPPAVGSVARTEPLFECRSLPADVSREP